jgi:lysophospholipase L1-like esterase
MKIISLTGAELRLLLVSVGLSVLLLAGAYEIFENIRYERWKSEFDVIGGLSVPSSNPVLMWEYRPNGQWAELTMNRWGFRDRDYETPAKPPGTYRIAFVGDSVALGLRTAAEDIFVRRFEEGANGLGLGHAVQALNFSVDGYNTVQVHEMLRTKVLAFAPDKVVYVLCLNDFDFEDSSGLKIQYFRKPKSFLLATVERVFRHRIYQQLAGNDFHRYYFHKNKQQAFEKIREMNGLLAQSGIGFHVVVVPVFFDSAPDFANYPVRDIHTQIGAFLSNQGIPHHDLLETFAEQRKPPASYSYDVWHPNAEGHLLIARRMLEVLLPRAGDRDDSASDRSKPPAVQPLQEREQGAAVMATCSNTDAQIVHAAPVDRAPSVAHRTRTPASACMRTAARPGELRSP